jgi:hypothetical protein
MRLFPVLVFCSIVPTLGASAEEPPAKEWEARITPYGWLSAINGSIEADGRSTDLAVGIDDVLSHFGGGGMLNGSLRWRRLLVLADVVFARLTDKVTSDSVEVGPPALPIEVGPLETDLTFWEVTAALNLGYRLLDLPFPGLGVGDASDPRRVFVDTYAGARFWWFDQQFELDIPATTVGGIPVPGGGRSRSISDDSWWVDPQIGFVVGARPWERFSFLVGGSVGGFGIGSASKFAWTGTLEGSWHFGEHWSLVVGYKGLGFDHDFGSGPTGGDLDIAMHGPLLGMSYRF